ncbi:MAG: outer membrane beta-barrel protein, partial [Candidatus Rokuibacteriota bacterium]
VVSAVAFALGSPTPVLAQPSEVDVLKDEIRKLQQRLERLERVPAPPPPAVAPGRPAAPVAIQPPPPGDREIRLDREHILETVGLPKPEVGGVKISGFFVGSASYNSHAQLLPEFAGGAPTLADPGSLNFRYDKFGLGVAKTFAPWLSAHAAIEVESHRDRHSHLITPGEADRRGCPLGIACERFGAEAAETEAVLDKFGVTVVAPLGNGLALSLGRFDVPFGIERHDEPLLLTATTSEVFRFGRPQRMTGLQAAYQVAPWLDVTTWVVNRWESETTHDPFDDNNREKSFGGRLGFTPMARASLLNFGIGAFFGPEQTDRSSAQRWVVDADVTWTPIPRLLLAGELVYGEEENFAHREVGVPIAMDASEGHRRWLGFYVLSHYDVVDWMGLSFRYGYFDDMDGGRTGVEQVLQSFTLAPIVHLSRLIPDLKPTGATYIRTRHPIHWVDLKLEYRLNLSDRNVFSDTRPGNAILDAEDMSHQLQLQLVVNF